MSDHPILFSSDMVRAILAGRKTMTRRILNPQPPDWIPQNDKPGFSDMTPPRHVEFRGYHPEDGYGSKFIPLRFWKGDCLWVREAYYQYGHWEPVKGTLTKGGRQKWVFIPANDKITFEKPDNCRLGRSHKDPYTPAWHKRLARFMPRKYSRTTLIVTAVKVERLQDINAEDSLAEGVGSTDFWRPANVEGRPLEEKWWDDHYFWQNYPQQAFRSLWESINGPGSWKENPFVAAYSFKPVFCNIDTMEAHS